MNTHLSALQISECVSGGAAPFIEQHARECPDRNQIPQGDAQLFCMHMSRFDSSFAPFG